MLEGNNTNQIIALKNTLSDEHKNFLNNYLSNAPHWFWESLQIVQKDKNQIFIKEGLDVDTVFILIHGMVKAIEYRICGIVYDYMWFYPIKVFGAMEVLLKMEKYRTTLMTITPCTMLVVSKSKFEAWMMSDLNALNIEIEAMGRSLLEQARKERVFLFLFGNDRMIYLFSQLYEQTAKDDMCVLKLTRGQLSERAGLCIKTINRSIQKMEKSGYIGRVGNKITITKKQYLAMKEYLSHIVDD